MKAGPPEVVSKDETLHSSSLHQHRSHQHCLYKNLRRQRHNRIYRPHITCHSQHKQHYTCGHFLQHRYQPTLQLLRRRRRLPLSQLQVRICHRQAGSLRPMSTKSLRREQAPSHLQNLVWRGATTTVEPRRLAHNQRGAKIEATKTKTAMMMATRTTLRRRTAQPQTGGTCPKTASSSASV